MRLKIINDLLEETERVFMAGARLAPGDIRLKKHIETLNKLGEKSPPFKKLAEKFSALYSADENSAAEALFEAAGVLQAVAAVMSDPTPEKPLTPHSGTLSYIKSYPLPYDTLHHMTVYLHAENCPINGGYDYFLDPRLYDFVPAALKSWADEKTIPNEAIKKIGSDLLPPLTELINDKKTTAKSKVCILRALHILGFPDTYKIACEILDNGKYVIETAEIIKDYPGGVELLKNRYFEISEIIQKKQPNRSIIDRTHHMFLAYMLFDGDDLYDQYFALFGMLIGGLPFDRFIFADEYVKESFSYFANKMTSKKWEKLFNKNNDTMGLILINFNNKKQLGKLVEKLSPFSYRRFPDKWKNEINLQIEKL